MCFLSLVSSAAKLKDVQNKEREWQEDQTHTQHPFAPKPGLPNKGKRKHVDTETKNSTSNVPPKRIRAAALKRNGREEPTSTSRRLPTGSASSSSTEATSDLAATHFYQLRLWKKGMCDLTEELTKDSDDEDL
ncbi:hypothetical protein PCANC_24337 [Puccinia coronata f. sp. avenae]|uniref:Uncharacterized protein n=1 Tax=Puccinia coronata f. sp. avenae TaxID=200324 RepID=A0A2N5TV95_9BASI|nr:hypothetical protein PCANC_24337 [Puccinia coronata f. sp. avenae]